MKYLSIVPGRMYILVFIDISCEVKITLEIYYGSHCTRNYVTIELN